MSEVKRYDVIADKYGDGTVEESESGSVVFYEDYAALKERFDFKQNLTEQIVELKAQRDALAAELSVVDAIHDECVFITDDDYDACPKSVQQIIRSLAVMQIPATEAYLNSVRAEGADKVAEYHFVRIDALKEMSRQGHLFHKGAYSDAVNVANLFRAGKVGE
ncbi:UNVERIFIED_ORG: hypothetical protein OKW14_001496 [Pantoea brenneri]|nr:hypothetical protein [Pantoea brenneri]